MEPSLIIAYLYIVLALLASIRLIFSIRQKETFRTISSSLAFLGSISGAIGFFIVKSLMQIIFLDIAVLLYLSTLIVVIIGLKKKAKLPSEE